MNLRNEADFSPCVLETKASTHGESLSEDLRIRVVQAVNGGMSRRAVAERFGVSPSSAVRFMREWRDSGTTRAKGPGGDQRSHRIEAHREVILRAITGSICRIQMKNENWNYGEGA